MKIGILTFHYSINQGSVLQAYCVQNLMQEWYPNAKVEIINLIPLMREKNELKFYSKEFPYLQIEKYRKYRSIRKFTKEKLNLSNKVFHNSIDKQIDYVNKQKYDIVCTGSDTVWVDTVKLKHKIPNIYFLPQEIKAKKISIASSVDPLNNAKRYSQNQAQLKDIFNSYSLITVRDKTTQTLVKGITDNKVNLIADPTILFDFEKELKFEKVKRFNNSNKKLISIATADRNLNNLLKKHLSKYGKTVDSYYTKDSKFDYITDELNNYHRFDAIVTDRFHRSIFALKLSSSMVINVERYNKNKTGNSKGRELFESIGISRYAVRFEQGKETNFIAQLENLFQNWDEEAFRERENRFQNFIIREKENWKNITRGAVIN